MKRRLTRKLIVKVAEYVAALVLGIILYKLCRSYAVTVRRNELYGGEVLMLGLPVWYGMVKSVIVDMVHARWKTEDKHERQMKIEEMTVCNYSLTKRPL